ncbi:C2CD3 protein, partial [Acromyrmex insinuator]
MDSQTKFNRSLPPLVEGKVHGSLRLVISEVLWIRTNPGDVTVVASWWGEHDNAKFRPKDSTTETERTNEDVTEFQEEKSNEMVTDKLVAQIVAKAQYLREVILKETYKEDSSTLNDSSSSNELHFNTSSENKEKLDKYILGMEMSSLEEKKVLNMLRPSCLIDLMPKIIATDKDNINTGWNQSFSIKLDSPEEDVLDKNMTCTELKGTYPLDYVNSIKIFVESFTLTSAGYRRAKSTCLQYDVPLSLTYFIQYDTTFGSTKQANKSSKETKFTRTYAKKQVGQVVNFNSEGIYSISRHNINKNFPLRFKVFVKHHNQKLPTGLGFGFINISDITNTTNLSSTQCIVIVNKGIKIGDLKVTIELGCDFIHFGKEFVDAVISKKENLPILNKKALTNPNDNKYKSATGTHSSKSNCEVSSVSAKQIKCLTSSNNKDMIITKDMTEHREQSLDNKKIDTSNPENGIKDKILLHGLIYVAEGKDLPESNTYLICRAFWREDKASSQICNNTKNPFYHFFQLVPLLHGIELLERIKDNYIIIEVYNRQNSGIDNLLGIAKLPVHQLYIAYRDPLVFPHLLLSKVMIDYFIIKCILIFKLYNFYFSTQYPVISVDGWVNINDPVNGKFCGKLLALVALGTAEQIALLEVSRGLRNTNNINNFAYHVYNMLDRDLASVDYKSQESQTDISSLKNARPQKPIQEVVSSEHLALRALVDRLTNVLHINKISTNQSIQTDINQVNEGKIHTELNTLNSNSLTDDCNPNNDFRLPMEVYRSVGVGAEYEDLDQQQNNANNFSNSSLTEENVQKIESNINCNSSFFRSMIEIECALHLPKIEGLNELMEPSTYVTFQDLTHKFNSTNQLNSYMVTNVCPYSCNPKWNWKCDVKLSTELLLNNQKRLILKVWHLIDPNTSKDINLRRDIVIGFSAIDLSILLTGFPTVSGWFHIMDFTGKCNGQIKISVTPLDNLSSLGKFAPTNSINLSRCNSLQTNWPSLYNVPCTNAELNGAHQISYENQNNNKYVQNDCKLNTHIGHNLEDVSISFLSSSLKQKLTELDEITKRLQSRLHDVTNTAFEDEFDNDFDIIELNIDNENTNDRNVKITHYPQSTVSEYFNTGTSQMSKQCGIQNDRNVVNDEKQTSSILSSNCNLRFDSASNKSRAISFEVTALGCCSSSNAHFSQHPYYHNQYQNRYSSTYNYLSDNNTEYPVRGTKAHINHLLDKLSLDLPPKSSSETTIPIRKNILELFTNLREHKNNSQDKDKNNYGINTCTVLTQTDNEQYPSSSTANFLTSKTTIEENISVEMPHNRISTVIREELVAEENNDSAICDELTTYLITSNVRHMNPDSIFNPLLYQHLVPDLQITAVSPEGEVVEQLDNRYIKNFTVHSDIDLLKENSVFQNDTEMKDRITVLECDKEFFGLTPSDISENIDNSIDMTVIYESSENDLTSDNNTESTAIMSFDKSSIQQTEIEIKNYSIVSELSVTGISRQAPEGGNPTEEVKTLLGAKQQNYIQDVSADN